MVETSTSAGTPPEEVDGPLDKILSLSEVCKAEGVSRWTIQRLIRVGKFPAGLELDNGRPGWPESWIKARRESKPRRTLGADTAPAPEAGAAA